LTAPADNVTNLRLILQNHVVGIGTKSDDLLAAGYTRTFASVRVPSSGTTSVNLNVFVNTVGTDVLVNGGVANGGAKVTTANIVASNGLIHVVDGVILLPTIVNHIKANPNLSSLLGVVTSAPQASVLATLTGATAAALSQFTLQTTVHLQLRLRGGYLVGKRICNYYFEISFRKW
jgi:hypothetical protein